MARGRIRRAPSTKVFINRFGSIDPNEGGNTARHQLFVVYKLRPSEHGELQALAYLGTYRFNLFSNFTLYLDDLENGDEIQQITRRTFSMAARSYRDHRSTNPGAGVHRPGARLPAQRRYLRRAGGHGRPCRVEQFVRTGRARRHSAARQRLNGGTRRLVAAAFDPGGLVDMAVRSPRLLFGDPG